MEKIIQELEAKRAAARRGYLICAAMGVALVVMLGTHQYTRALAVLALTVIVYLLLARQDIKGFSDAYRKAAAQAAMGKWLEDAAYHGKEGSPPQQLRDARLLPVKEGNGCVTYHRITGRGAGTAWELCDASFQGKLDRPTGQRLRMVSRNIVTPALLAPYFLERTDFRPMVWENLAVDQEFSSFAPAGQLPQLPDGVLDRLLELTEKTPGSVALGLDDDVLTVMLCHRFVTTGDPIVRDPVTRERLEQQALPELEQVLALAAACQGVEG